MMFKVGQRKKGLLALPVRPERQLNLRSLGIAVERSKIQS
jgi:hypothetical protein